MPEGLSDVLREVDRVSKVITADALEGANKVGNKLLTEAQRNCPVKSGNLRNSGYVRVLGFEVEVGFSAPYAAAVHESINARHESGEAKFLETPFKLLAGNMAEEVAKEVKI